MNPEWLLGLALGHSPARPRVPSHPTLQYCLTAVHAQLRAMARAAPQHCSVATLIPIEFRASAYRHGLQNMNGEGKGQQITSAAEMN